MIQTELCQRIFNLNFPPTEIELKSKFRDLAHKSHPDRGGSAEVFRELRDAYDMLLGYTTEAKKYIDKTTQGDLLVDLGQGLGPTTNGDHCKGCNSLGYRVETRSTGNIQQPCPFCDTKCGRCAGRGKLTSGPCPECQGRGTFINHYCTFCRGRRYWSKPLMTQVYVTCSTCGGKGEIWIMNPVLPKGAVL